ncbi:MAG: zinc ribbon domain-containing protein [Gemmatimonadetes bacterium]|nr:zinc ribbon domain-containing protein [Gemmatimonadota bacterium]MBI2616106.1 zinc ribbon domain-containing protein [Gemmatimonadota bacterium]
MDELDRLFHHVVRAVAALGTDRVREPIPITELYQELVPYRQNRSALRFDTQQDYEAAMLRLLAGERGYARVEPAEAQQALAAEAGAAYPETGVFREFAAARVYLSPQAAQTVLAGEAAYAPPSPPTTTPAGGAAEAAGAAGAAAEESGAMEESCPYCDAELPKGRQLFYCPFCGGNLKGVRCPECRTELEVGWLYCVTCGRKMGGD